MYLDAFDVRNPVIQRLTSNNGALRNESYYKVSLHHIFFTFLPVLKQMS